MPFSQVSPNTCLSIDFAFSGCWAHSAKPFQGTFFQYGGSHLPVERPRLGCLWRRLRQTPEGCHGEPIKFVVWQTTCSGDQSTVFFFYAWCLHHSFAFPY